jgi:short-subunit dehydrogenase
MVSGIGYELARQCAQNGLDLIIAADEPEIGSSASQLRASGVDVVPVKADLATDEGVGELVSAAEGRPVAALIANAGRGLGGGFLDQDFREVRHVINTNVTGTLDLIQRIGKDMRQRGSGRVLITGSIAGFMPGTFQAAYNGTKAFIDSFALALRNELKGTGVAVTCLMPGPTNTEFFRRAGMLDTKWGRTRRPIRPRSPRSGSRP